MPLLTLASDFSKATENDWRERVADTLKGRAFDSLVTETLDGLKLKPLYRGTAEPATVPRRGAAEPPWTIMQRIDIPDVARANAQAREDVENGAGGLVLVWPGSVSAGAHGVAVANPDDFERLTDGIELDLIALRLDAGGFGNEAVQLVFDLYEARNLDIARCDVAFGLDPLGNFALTGRAADVEVLKRDLAESVSAIAGRGHGGPAMLVDTRVYHGGGASEAQELAAGLATAIQYLRWLEALGHDLEDAARRIGFVLTADADQFLTIAKLRAARLLWSRAQAAMGLAPHPVVVHVETAMRMMSRHDPHVNLLRTTTAALAAGVGGADAVTVLPFTAALGLPDGFARRLARGLQVMLQEESGIGRVADAGAGSGLVEAATSELAAVAWGVFQAIEAQGGMLAGLQSGFVQGRIAEAASARRQRIAERRFGLTGVSRFPRLDEVAMDVLDVPLPETWRVEGRENTIACTPLAQARVAQPFEALRDAGDAAVGRGGERPALFLANLGAIAEHDARARWVRNLFAAGGIAALADDGFDSPEAAAKAFRASGAQIACLCGSDRGYAAMGVAAAEALRAAGAVRIYVAGRPGELEGAGIDEFLYDGIDVVATLERLHEVLGCRLSPA
ncbi:MAG TPA: methylmalonyl-CoA mutase family protein [Aestuariivirgaceae bacterium]|nr:methylmalonyl-CoA mutase family protein [Aestuariivirgaceae bacterium]